MSILSLFRMRQNCVSISVLFLLIFLSLIAKVPSVRASGGSSRASKQQEQLEQRGDQTAAASEEEDTLEAKRRAESERLSQMEVRLERMKQGREQRRSSPFTERDKHYLRQSERSSSSLSARHGQPERRDVLREIEGYYAYQTYTYVSISKCAAYCEADDSCTVSYEYFMTCSSSLTITRQIFTKHTDKYESECWPGV